MSDYETENAAYEKGKADAIQSERERILKIVETELMSDYGNAHYKVWMFRDIKAKVLI